MRRSSRAGPHGALQGPTFPASQQAAMPAWASKAQRSRRARRVPRGRRPIGHGADWGKGGRQRRILKDRRRAPAAGRHRARRPSTPVASAPPPRRTSASARRAQRPVAGAPALRPPARIGRAQPRA
eukprot:5203777-Pyramimonas_sp.AAC.1